MVFNINYSIREILEKKNLEDNKPEIEYLLGKIEEYRISMENRVEAYLQELEKMDIDNKYRWIQENVDIDVRRYVIVRLQGNSANVLMKSANKWKTISDIGVEVCETTRAEKDYTEWFEIWEKQAKSMAAVKAEVYESHAHYNLENYDNIREKLLTMMYNSGVKNIIVPAIEYNTIAQMKEIFDGSDYDYIKYAFGSHPKYISKETWDENRWEEFEKKLDDKKCVAVGECGLDYSKKNLDSAERKLQMELFARFVDIANKKKMPLVLHIRPADYLTDCEYDVNEDALSVLNNHPIEYGAVLHCFGGNISEVKAYEAVGVTHFGIGGRICYGNAELEQAVKEMRTESILLETDSPYIKLETGPLPNTSLALTEVAEKIALLRGVSVAEIMNSSRDNAKRLFDSK